MLVPDWCSKRLGKFYLYFSDHSGDHIELAFSDKISGPWKVKNGGVLDLKNFSNAYDHIASPDIFVSNKRKTITMYFHSRARSKGREQWTFAAISKDGLNFSKPIDRPLAPFYLRVFFFDGFVYGISKGGNLWRSEDGVTDFELGTNLFYPDSKYDYWQNEAGSIRHVAVDKNGFILDIYFSRIGDCPERILRSSIELNKSDWREWKTKEVVEILKPEEDYEGKDINLSPSVSGPANFAENALRDPYLFSYHSSKYLFYTVSGEKGIAVCDLNYNG